MKKCSSKRVWAYVLALLMFVQTVIVPIPASAGVEEADGEYEIYPTPQSFVYGSGTTDLTDEVNVTCGDAIDDYTKTRIEDTLAVLGLQQAESDAEGNTKLTVGVYGSDDEADTYGKSHNVDASIYENFDSYTLWIDNGEIVILGKNTDAAYYGVTSLKRIFEQLEENTVKNLTLKDYAEIEFRGFIEGYYGNPWSKADRIDLMKFGGEIKMNQYVFAPKDDPYHNAKWRDLYPTEEDPDGSDITDITELARAGNESKCFFVYALHPFQNNPLTEENYAADLEVVKNKFAQVIEAGVRQVAILEDDASANGRWSADTLARLLTDIENWLKEMKKTYPDLKTDLLFCPGWMAYANGMTDSNNSDVQKIKQIYEKSPDEVRMVMTGGKVWGEVNDAFSDNFYARLAETSKGGSYPYLWVNWPCNDNTHNSLIMGGHNYILHEGISPEKYQGVILNPMQHSEPSKVAIFTASDYLWKVWQDEAEGDQAWEDSFKYIDHMTPLETEESNALREVARHMINQKPSQPQIQFEESVKIKDQLNSFRDKMKMETLTQEDITSMRAEFEKIDDAINLYMKQGNERIVNQMEPFMNSFRDTVEADMYLLDALKAILSDDAGKVYNAFAEAQMLNERSKTYGLWYVDHTEYALGGRKYIQPFTTDVMKYVSDKVKLIVDPEHVELEKTLLLQVGGNTVSPDADAIKKMTDGNLDTNHSVNTDQKVGDYCGMAFNIPVKVNQIQIALARTANPNDFIYEGKLEYTQDGKTWEEFAAEFQPAAGTNEVNLEFETSMEIRGFRWRCTGLGNPSNRYLVVREIGFVAEGQKPNVDIGDVKYAATFSRTEGWSLAAGSGPETNMTDDNDTSQTWYDPSTSKKDHSLVGDYIQLDLGEVKSVGRVRAIVGGVKNGSPSATDKWKKYHLEYSETGEDNSWTRLDSYTDSEAGAHLYEVNLGGESARYIRLVNDQEVNVWVIFCDFSAYSYVEGSVKDGDAMDYTNTEDEDWRVEYGDESSKVFPREDVTLEPNQYIGLKLDRIHAIDQITIEGTGISALAAEKSMNAKEWSETDVKGAARYIRLMNKTNSAVTFSLTSFTVETDEILPMDLFDTNIGNSNPSEDARDTNTTRTWMDGDLTTSAKYTAAPSAGTYVTYDLGQEIDINSVRVWTSIGNKDYPRDAKIQASLTADENAAWQDILVIGDGVADDRNESFDKAPQDNGWTPGTGAVGVNYAYMENSEVPNVKARYLRLYFTAANAGRWVALNEIELNDGEYFPAINDPTFEIDVDLMKGFEPQNLTDRNLTTPFKTEDVTSGSLIYHLSDDIKVDRLNILQSGSSLSNATVSVRTGADHWETIGTLYRSFSSFYTGYYENVYDVKLEWNNVIPVIYEIITLQNPGDVLDRNVQDAQNQVADAQANLEKAEADLADITSKVNAAKDKVDQAADGSKEKLKAEAEYYRLRAEKYGLEASVAQNTALKLIGEAELARAEAQNLRSEAAGKPDGSEKDQLIQQAEEKEAGISDKLTEAQDYQETAAEKKTLQAEDEKTAADKKAEFEGSGTVYYDVTFESNGGSDVDSQKIKPNGTVKKPANPTKSGFIFDGWYSDEDLTEPYDFKSAVKSDLTLYAGWKKTGGEEPADEYTVTFDSKGGSKVESVKVAAGETVEEPEEPTREHYIFDGWFIDEALQTEFDFVNDIVESDITLYAKWRPDDSGDVTFHKVTFESNGGTAIAEQDVIDGDKVIQPVNPTKEGYTFDAWYTEAACTNKYDFEKAVTDNFTLYANWIEGSEENPTEYTVTFDSNGGSSVVPQTVKQGEKAKKPASPIKSGYTFNGWYDKTLTKVYDFNTPVTEDITLYAKWTKKAVPPAPTTVNYTVTFDSKGGTAVPKQTVKKNGTVRLSNPTKKGYKFDGWYTDSACTKKFAPATKVTKNMTLYAKWTLLIVLPQVGEKKTVGDLIYKITNSHATEGTVSVAGMSKNSKKKIAIPPTVTIDNIRFKVTAIEAKAFTKGKKLTTVEIGENITKINASAFLNCKKLKTIKFKTVKTPKFGSKVFKGTNSKCKVFAPKKMSKKEFKNFKNKCKKAGMSKKATYKKK